MVFIRVDEIHFVWSVWIVCSNDAQLLQGFLSNDFSVQVK